MNQPGESPPFRVRRAGDLGLAVKYFRGLAGISQAELAARAGVHRAYLSELEGGHATEILERLTALFAELGVRIVVQTEAP